MYLPHIIKNEKGIRRFHIIVSNLRRIKNKYGIKGLIKYVFYRLRLPRRLEYSLIYSRLNDKFSFYFNNAKLYYFYHPYNSTWLNERCIEIPLIRHLLKQHRHSKRMLEVGNVLSHYFSVSHDIVDKYEKEKGVINEDILNFFPKKKYDLIISISTLEHIGIDEIPRERKKVIKAIHHLVGLLRKGGRMYFTFPIGYNKLLDDLIFERKIDYKEAYFFKRKNYFNQWIQTTKQEVYDVQYNFPFLGGNAISLVIIQK